MLVDNRARLLNYRYSSLAPRGTREEGYKMRFVVRVEQLGENPFRAVKVLPERRRFHLKTSWRWSPPLEKTSAVWSPTI